MGLDLAVKLLEEEGYIVVTREVRSKKGVPDGDDKRVIRVRSAGSDNTVCLAYSVFKTAVSEKAEEVKA
jgi:hypothetical protein